MDDQEALQRLLHIAALNKVVNTEEQDIRS